jgi:hypothetical protein
MLPDVLRAMPAKLFECFARASRLFVKRYISLIEDMPMLDKFCEWLSNITKTQLAIFFSVVTLYFGIHVLVIVVEGNRDPSLPMTTACPVLSAVVTCCSVLLTCDELSRRLHDARRVQVPTQPSPPNQFPIFQHLTSCSMQPSFGYHMRMFVRPSASLDIIVEHRCYNHNVGTSFLWVNNQLAAFSTLDISDVDKVTSMAVNGADGAIFDCHGKRLWRTSYERIKDNKEPKLRVYSDSGVHIYTSSIPEDTSEADGPQIVYSQPENVECARLSTDWKFTVSNPLSPACDPRLLAMLYANSFFFAL